MLFYTATFFLEFWKRKQKMLEYDWDVTDFELEEVNTAMWTFNSRSNDKVKVEN